MVFEKKWNKHMNIKDFFKEINSKVNFYHKNAKNPFLEYNYAQNPFKSVIRQTYVWVEKPNEKD